MTLNNQALARSRFVLSGALNVAEFMAVFIAAGLAAGLGQRETERTTASAVRAGLRFH